MLERNRSQPTLGTPARSRMETMLRVYSNPDPSGQPRPDELSDDRPKLFAVPVYARSIGRDRFLLFRSKMLSRMRLILSCRSNTAVSFVPGVSILELTVMLHDASLVPLQPEYVTLLAKYTRFIDAGESDAVGFGPGLELTVVQAAPEDAIRWQDYLASL